MTHRPRSGYGAPIRTERYRDHEIARMPWPCPCETCGKATSTEVDGRRWCRICLREVLG